MAHHGVDIDLLSRKLNQVLVLMSHCKFDVPDEAKRATELMETALELGGLDTLVENCSKVLENTLCAENAIRLFELGQNRSIVNLSTEARKFILANFMTVFKTKEFLALGVQPLLSFLRSDELKVDSEETVFDALIAWVKRDPKTRRGHVQNLVNSVRLTCCDIKFLKTLSDHFLLHDKDEFKEGLNQLMEEMENKPDEVARRAEQDKRHPRN